MISKLKNIFKKKDLHKIPLHHVHTFKTGEKLYTYSKEQYGTIASRYYRALNIALNYITMYGADAKTVQAYFDKTLENNKKELELLYQCKKSFSLKTIDEIIDLVLANNTLTEFQKAYVFDKTALQLQYQEMLFCMFYLLEDEIEGGYSEIFNKRKLDLINKDIDMRDIFFSSVQNIAKGLDIILEVDTETMIKQTVKLLELQLQNIQTTSGETG